MKDEREPSQTTNPKLKPKNPQKSRKAFCKMHNISGREEEVEDKCTKKDICPAQELKFSDRPVMLELLDQSTQFGRYPETCLVCLKLPQCVREIFW